MPTFDAGKSIESLDWDFTTLPNWPKALSKAKGTIREPSDAMIGAFLDGMKTLYTDAKAFGIDLPEDATPMQITAAIDDVTGDEFVRLMGMLVELYSKLCGGNPSEEMITELPLRVRIKFFAWLVEEVVRPEAGSGAGAQVVSIQQHAAAG